jgi:hypothetical protein
MIYRCFEYGVELDVIYTHDLALMISIDLQFLPPVYLQPEICKETANPSKHDYDKYLQYYISRKLNNYEDL